MLCTALVRADDTCSCCCPTSPRAQGGIFVGNVIVLARANVAKAAQGVLLSLQIRSENGDISEIIAGSVG